VTDRGWSTFFDANPNCIIAEKCQGLCFNGESNNQFTLEIPDKDEDTLDSTLYDQYGDPPPNTDPNDYIRFVTDDDGDPKGIWTGTVVVSQGPLWRVVNAGNPIYCIVLIYQMLGEGTAELIPGERTAPALGEEHSFFQDYPALFVGGFTNTGSTMTAPFNAVATCDQDIFESSATLNAVLDEMASQQSEGTIGPVYQNGASWSFDYDLGGFAVQVGNGPEPPFGATFVDSIHEVGTYTSATEVGADAARAVAEAALGITYSAVSSVATTLYGSFANAWLMKLSPINPSSGDSSSDNPVPVLTVSFTTTQPDFHDFPVRIEAYFYAAKPPNDFATLPQTYLAPAPTVAPNWFAKITSTAGGTTAADADNGSFTLELTELGTDTVTGEWMTNG
jgi:hypothetical protein